MSLRSGWWCQRSVPAVVAVLLDGRAERPLGTAVSIRNIAGPFAHRRIVAAVEARSNPGNP
jgi:hypothetical protein